MKESQTNPPESNRLSELSEEELSMKEDEIPEEFRDFFLSSATRKNGQTNLSTVEKSTLSAEKPKSIQDQRPSLDVFSLQPRTNKQRKKLPGTFFR
jgi:hypothetical protein